jgi:hypothetical protein
MDVVGGLCAVDGDPPRLHGLGDIPQRLDPRLSKNLTVGGGIPYINDVLQRPIGVQNHARILGTNERVAVKDD